MNPAEKMEKLAIRSRWVSLAGLALVIAALLYSAISLNKQQHLLELKRGEIKNLNIVIEKTRKDIELKRKDLAECVVQLEDIHRKLEESRFRLAQQAAAVALAAFPDTSFTAPRIYIHIQRQDQREEAMAIRARLEAAGYMISDDLILVEKGTKSNQLRFFHQDDVGEARKIVAILDSLGFSTLLNDLSAAYDSTLSDSTRYYELWLGKQAAVLPKIRL